MSDNKVCACVTITAILACLGISLASIFAPKENVQTATTWNNCVLLKPSTADDLRTIWECRMEHPPARRELPEKEPR